MKSLIITRYYGPTHTKGSRIRCQSWKGTTWHNFDYAARCPHTVAAIDHAVKKFSFTGVGHKGLSEISGINPEKAFIFHA